jgi:hypothetical protein
LELHDALGPRVTLPYSELHDARERHVTLACSELHDALGPRVTLAYSEHCEPGLISLEVRQPMQLRLR